MRVLSKKTLRDFWERHPDSEQPLKAWNQEVTDAEWAAPVQLKERYPRASILADNRVVFDIGRNKYRLMVWVRYRLAMVYVKWIGTDAEYNHVDAGKMGR